MKHGQRGKTKTAKTTSKASSRKTSGQKTPSKGQSGRISGGKKQESRPPAKSKQDSKSSTSVRDVKAGGRKEADVRGAAPARGAAVKIGGDVVFTTPEVAAAFKRALKKYPTALKRLTD